jgi:quercetin dioxygenase-like cupin family protein
MKKSTAKITNILYGRLSKVKKQKMPWGEIGILWENWDELKLNGSVIDFTKEASYKDWANTDSENLCIVEQGTATISLNGKPHNVNKKHVFKVYPGQAPVIKPKGKFTILSIQMPK